jgi:protoheme IX farnesyltransferase
VSIAQARVAPAPLIYLKDLLLLAKPRLSSLVLVTAAGGMALAPGRLGVARAVTLLLGTAAVVGAANALNNFIEHEIDARMRRTRERPIPAGRVEPFVALGLGIAVPAFAIPLIALAANRVTAVLALTAIVTYVLVYTPMKRRSTLALFVGAIPGAIPPLMGWTGVTGRVDAGGMALFALLFAWQLPHFLAVSIYLKEDYARGGLKVFALVHGDDRTRRWIVGTTAALVPVSLLLVPLGLAGPVYATVAGAGGVALAWYAVAGLRRPDPIRWSRTFFLATLVHLTLLFAALFTGW